MHPLTPLQFIIVLDDENDNAPVFTRDPFEIYTPDKREPNKILGQVTARDADQGNNGKVVYTMIAGDTGQCMRESGLGQV